MMKTINIKSKQKQNNERFRRQLTNTNGRSSPFTIRCTNYAPRILIIIKKNSNQLVCSSITNSPCFTSVINHVSRVNI